MTSIYLSTEPQSNMGFFNMGLPSLSPMLVGLLLTLEPLSPVNSAMVYTAAIVATTAACAVASVIAAWSVTILSYFLAWSYLLVFAETALFESPYLYCFYSWHYDMLLV